MSGSWKRSSQMNNGGAIVLPWLWRRSNFGHLYLQPMVNTSILKHTGEHIVFSSCVWLIYALIFWLTRFKCKTFLSNLLAEVRGKKKSYLYTRNYWEAYVGIPFIKGNTQLKNGLNSTGEDSLLPNWTEGKECSWTWKATLNESLSNFQTFQRELWL